MLKLDLFSSASVTVTIEQNDLFLTPSFDPTLPQEQMLNGTILLLLPKPRLISRILAKLTSTSIYTAGGRTNEGRWGEESETVLNKEVEIKLGVGNGGEMLEKGEHTFSFTFLVPSNSAPFQRSEYGRTQHFVSASVEGVGSMSKKITSPLCAVYFVTLPPQVGAGELLPVTNEAVGVFDERLGPVSITFFSPHLTVSSLLHIGLSLPSPLVNLTIKSITGLIHQSWTITYPSGKLATLPPRRHVLFTQTTSTALVQGQSWQTSQLSRLLHDDVLRPTTFDESDTKIRVSHKLGLEIRYQAEGQTEDHIWTVAKPATIIACCCPVQSIRLPRYVAKETVQPKKMRSCYCVCLASFEELAEDPALEEVMNKRKECETVWHAEVLPASARANKSPTVVPVMREACGLGEAVPEAF